MRFTVPRRAFALACAAGLGVGALSPAVAHAQEGEAPAASAGIEALTNPSVLTVTRDPDTQDLSVTLQNNADGEASCMVYVYEKPIVLQMLGEAMTNPAAVESGDWSDGLKAQVEAADADGKGVSDTIKFIRQGQSGSMVFGGWNGAVQPENKDWAPAGIAACSASVMDENGDYVGEQQFIELAPAEDVNPILGSVANLPLGSLSGGEGEGSGSTGSLMDQVKSLITPEFIFGGGGSLGSLTGMSSDTEAPAPAPAPAA